MDKKLRTFLRKEMMKLNRNLDTKISDEHKIYIGAFCQAKFDLLMDIDREFQLGAFYKKGKNNG